MIALGTDSGPIFDAFWLPKSDQIGPRRGPKSIKKVIEKLVEFGIDFSTISGHFWAQMEVGSHRANLKNLKNPSLGLKM